MPKSSEKGHQHKDSADKKAEELDRNFKKMQEEYLRTRAEQEPSSGPTEPFRPKSFKPPTRSQITQSKSEKASADAAKANASDSRASEHGPQSTPHSNTSNTSSTFNTSNDIPHTALPANLEPEAAVPRDLSMPESGPAGDDASTLGRIEPKKLTVEEAEALGIDTSHITGKKRMIFELPADKKKREHDEKVKRAGASDGRPRWNFRLDKYVDAIRGTDKWWWIIGGLILLPPVIEFIMDPDHKFIDEPEGVKTKPNWGRMEYTYLADSRTESIIFEMCGMTAIGALPPFNPVSSPLHAVRGAVSPIYPRQRQGLTPPVFWKLRIDFPGPRETVWEKNDFMEATVRPASPDYRGSQFMWILARTWDHGEPVIRVLAGKQVGGTVKANPQRSLLPWRNPVFRPRRLSNTLLRHFESDLMFDSLFEEDTMMYRIFKWFNDGSLERIQSRQVGYELEEYEFDMLDAHGYGDYMYDPESVEWPADIMIVDPLGVQNDGDPYGPTQSADSRPDEFEYDDLNDQYEQYGDEWDGEEHQLEHDPDQQFDDGPYDDQYDDYEDDYEDDLYEPQQDQESQIQADRR